DERLGRVRRQHDRLPRRPAGRAGRAGRRRPRRRGRGVARALARDAARDLPRHVAHPHPAAHRGLPGVRPGLRAHQGRPGQLAPDARLLHLRPRVRPPGDGVRLGAVVRAVPRHPRLLRGQRPRHRTGERPMTAATAVAARAAAPVEATPRPPTPRAVVGKVVWVLAVVLISVTTVMPLVWTLSTSLKPEGEILSSYLQLLPSTPTLENYLTLFTDGPFGRYLANSA